MCGGDSSDRAAHGGARTNVSGAATLRVPRPQLGDGATPIITAEAAGRGAEQPFRGFASVTIRLPPEPGGPACRDDAQRTPALGKVQLDRRRVVADLQRNPTSPIGPRIGELRRVERCFGAIGMQCGDLANGQVSTCLTGEACLVNAGSWTHDECCVRNPNGFMCGGASAGPGAACAAEFALGAARLNSPYNWTRRVDPSLVNSTGVVDHERYCALAGAPMPAGEAEFCCSRAVRQLLPGSHVCR